MNTKKISSYKDKVERADKYQKKKIHKKHKKNTSHRGYKIICFLCEQEKYVPLEPIEGIPVLCDECLMEMEARRLLDKGGALKTKKLECKWCGETFYALNESYLFCDTCYDKFSHEIKARRKGLVPYTCDYCSKETWISPNIIEIKKKKGLPILCKECKQKEENKIQKERSKARIEKVKKALKKNSTDSEK